MFSRKKKHEKSFVLNRYLVEQHKKQMDMLYKYLDLQGLSKDSVQINNVALGEAYRYSDFSEVKTIDVLEEMSTIAYWIVKLKPFSILEKTAGEKVDLKINEGFAAFLIFGAVAGYCLSKDPNYKFTVSDEYRELFMDTMKFGELNVDSLILITNSLCVNFS